MPTLNLSDEMVSITAQALLWAKSKGLRISTQEVGGDYGVDLTEAVAFWGEVWNTSGPVRGVITDQPACVTCGSPFVNTTDDKRLQCQSCFESYQPVPLREIPDERIK
jgi:hypothetical protein